MRMRPIVPRFIQAFIGDIEDPPWAANVILLAKILDGRSAKHCPSKLLRCWVLWEFYGLSDEHTASSLMVGIPAIHEVAKRYPRIFAFDNFLVHTSHSLRLRSEHKTCLLF